MDYELLFLKSLALTILIETAAIVIYFQFIVKRKEIEISRLLITGFIVSFATLPYLWFVLPHYIDTKIEYMIIGESFAVLMEAILIGVLLRIKFVQSFLCSLVCNMVSFSTGLLIGFP